MRYLGKVNFPPQVRRMKKEVRKAQEKSQEDLFTTMPGNLSLQRRVGQENRPGAVDIVVTTIIERRAEYRKIGVLVAKRRESLMFVNSLERALG